MPRPETIYKLSSKMRTVTLTVTFIGIIALLIDVYIRQEPDAIWFIVLGALGWNVIHHFIIKPRPPISDSPIVHDVTPSNEPSDDTTPELK